MDMDPRLLDPGTGGIGGGAGGVAWDHVDCC